MEQFYRLERRPAAAANAREAAGAEARLAHLKLVGRSSVKAAEAIEAFAALTPPPPLDTARANH